MNSPFEYLIPLWRARVEHRMTKIVSEKNGERKVFRIGRTYLILEYARHDLIEEWYLHKGTFSNNGSRYNVQEFEELLARRIKNSLDARLLIDRATKGY